MFANETLNSTISRRHEDRSTQISKLKSDCVVSSFPREILFNASCGAFSDASCERSTNPLIDASVDTFATRCKSRSIFATKFKASPGTSVCESSNVESIEYVKPAVCDSSFDRTCMNQSDETCSSESKILSQNRLNPVVNHVSNPVSINVSANHVEVEFKSNIHRFLTDSGATHHMSGNRDLFSKILWNKSSSLKCANGSASGKCYVGRFIPNSFGLRTGIYHPALKVSIIGVEKNAQKGGKYVHAKD